MFLLSRVLLRWNPTIHGWNWCVFSVHISSRRYLTPGAFKGARVRLTHRLVSKSRRLVLGISGLPIKLQGYQYELDLLKRGPSRGLHPSKDKTRDFTVQLFPKPLRHAPDRRASNPPRAQAG